MSKKQLVALAVALSVLGVPLALAAPASAVTSASTVTPIFTDRDDHEDDEDGEEEDDEDDNEGNEDNHSIPPLVIRPHGDEDGDDEDAEAEDEDGDDDDSGFVLPSNPMATPDAASEANATTYGNIANGANYSVSPLVPGAAIPPLAGSNLTPGSGLEAVNGVNPEAAPAIDPATIRTSAKTPADVFMESATWGLMAMGAGAVALGSVAGVKTLSARRKPNGDYFYDSEN